jgi:hypothetical protein
LCRVLRATAQSGAVGAAWPVGRRAGEVCLPAAAPIY